MQLLIVVVDRVHADPVRHAEAPKAGDVIHWWPDGKEWGREEYLNPEWRIVHVPGMTEAEAEALIGMEVPVRPIHEHVLRNRHMTVDIAKAGILSQGKLPRRWAHKAGSYAPERSVERHDCVIDLETFRAAVSLKAPVFRASIIGLVENVIG